MEKLRFEKETKDDESLVFRKTGERDGKLRREKIVAAVPICLEKRAKKMAAARKKNRQEDATLLEDLPR